MNSVLMGRTPQGLCALSELCLSDRILCWSIRRTFVIFKAFKVFKTFKAFKAFVILKTLKTFKTLKTLKTLRTLRKTEKSQDAVEIRITQNLQTAIRIPKIQEMKTARLHSQTIKVWFAVGAEIGSDPSLTKKSRISQSSC